MDYDWMCTETFEDVNNGKGISVLAAGGEREKQISKEG